MGATRLHYHRVLTIAEHLSSSMDGREVRARAGAELLTLLQADYFASFIWDRAAGSVCEPVAINIDPCDIQRYCSYFQYRNPIAERVRGIDRAVRVDELVPQRELMRTEFYHDFLARGGLHHGLNLYVSDSQHRIADIRIWRRRERGNFQRREVQLLEMIKPHFRNSMSNILGVHRQRPPDAAHDELPADPGSAPDRLRSRFRLTQREAQVAAAIAEGSTDRQIAAALGISFTTIRTHINHIFERTGVRNRAALARLVGMGG